MIETSSHFIPVPGGQVWSQKLSIKDNLTKTPIIFLHGGPGSSHDLLKYGLSSLVNHNPLIFYDQLGSGKSNLSEKELTNKELWQISRFVAELEQVVDFYNLSEFHLFGSSWGAALALEYIFTAKHPKAKSILLSSPLVSAPMWMNDATELKKQMPKDIYEVMLHCEQSGETDSIEYQKAIESFENKHGLCKNMLNFEQLQLFESVKSKFNMHAYLTMWGPSEFHATGSLGGYDRYLDLAQIKIPTMFLCGEFDEARPETVEMFHKQVPGSHFQVFKNCSHRAYFEDSSAFCEVVQQFLDLV